MTKTIISGIALLALVIVLNTKFAVLPPLGAFFDPQAGFWANAEISEPQSETLILTGLENGARIYFDERRVPHIFADNEYDLYFAQGYITARDRLFQMEIQTYDAAGRLSELLGKATLERDLHMRRLGMVYGAEQALAEIQNDPQIYSVISAYSDGVNAYIQSLKKKDYPLEYKILGIAPEKWEPIKTAFLLKNMTYSLAGYNNDLPLSNTAAFLGLDFLQTFFSGATDSPNTIIPPSKKWDFEADTPSAPEEYFTPSISSHLQPFAPNPANGSNNWAVSGAKTANGYPILSNDPHLGMTLPPIWYEIQLSAPEVNTYGVSLPGSPVVIIGFNEQAAWGVTNVGADVMDWYEVKFRDHTNTEYWHDGQWKPVFTRIEEIKIRGGESVYDTLIFTHHGPVHALKAGEDAEPVYHALRWIAHEPSNDLRTFYELNRAGNYDEYVQALSHHTAPAQNFVYADIHGDIALWVNGKFPNKWKFQGRTISDGTDARYDWQGWIPHEQNPWVKNPPRGFVSSANQQPAGVDYPHYLGEDFATEERGRRINERLEAMANITPEDMRLLLLDTYSFIGKDYLEILLPLIHPDSLNETEKQVLEHVANWDFMNRGDEIAPSLMREWRTTFTQDIMLDESRAAKAPIRWPPRDRLIDVIKNQPDFKYFDDINTPDIREDINFIALKSFRRMVANMQTRYGALGENWKWKYYNNTDLEHLAYIPGLGLYNLETDGSGESVNAISGSHGPSWRMVVELGPEVKGWGVYPGGASGNPGSSNFISGVEPWVKGELFELNFMRAEPQQFSHQLQLVPAN